MTNSIGDFEFIDLVGEVVAPARSISVFARAGTDGVSAFDDGTRGTPFQLESRVDAASRAAARSAFAEYLSIVGTLVPLVQADIEYEDEGFKVLVVAVEPVEIRTLAFGSGGLNPPSLGWCAARWHLVAVAD